MAAPMGATLWPPKWPLQLCRSCPALHGPDSLSCARLRADALHLVSLYGVHHSLQAIRACRCLPAKTGIAWLLQLRAPR